MDIYKNSVARIKHVPVPGEQYGWSNVSNVTYEVFSGGISVSTGNALFESQVDGPDYYYFTAGPPLTSTSGELKVVFRYTQEGFEVEHSESLNIVNPYVSMSRMLMMPELDGYSHVELRSMERLVAGIIDVYTNQTFNRDNDIAYTVMGNDGDSLALPRRIVRLESVEMLDGTDGISPYPLTEYVTYDVDSPWTLRRLKDFDVSRKMSPTRVHRFFRYPELYRVTGDWGWDVVPGDVSRAAEILVKEYFCDDAKYREKYIDNIRAGDWRMEFKVTGDETTGSANADMLLSGYRNVGLAVI